jgi:hypothetical protein
MASETDICNRALQKVGEARIADITEDVKAARECNAMFDAVRDTLLGDPRAVWNFATRRAVLSVDGTEPAWGFAGAYPLPANAIRILEVDGFGHGDWRVEDHAGAPAILVDATGELHVRYVARITDTAVYPPLFAEALACQLALQLVETLTQSNTKKQLIAQELEQCLALARRADAREGAPRTLPDTGWAQVRG